MTWINACATSYIGSMGDSVFNISYNTSNRRGFFGGGYGMLKSANMLTCRSMASLTDGTSNTVAMSEALIGQAVNSKRVDRGIASISGITGMAPNKCITYVDTTDRTVFNSSTTGVARNHGMNFANGWSCVTAFTTVLPPNSPSCLEDTNGSGNGYISPNSNHSGGVNCLIADGSVKFVSETVNCGDLSIARTADSDGKSYYGVWGAMGSFNGSEPVSL